MIDLADWCRVLDLIPARGSVARACLLVLLKFLYLYCGRERTGPGVGRSQVLWFHFRERLYKFSFMINVLSTR